MKKLQSNILLFILLVFETSIFAIDADLFVKKAIDKNNPKEPKNATYLVDNTVIQYEQGDFSKPLGKKISKERHTLKEGEDYEVETLEEVVEGEFDMDKKDKDKDKDIDENEDSEEESEDNSESQDFNMSAEGENFPLSEEGFSKYDFNFEGIKQINGKDVYEISFDPFKKSKDFLVGSAFFSTSDSLLRRIDFQMAKNMTGLKHFEMSMDFDYIEGFTIMTAMNMKMFFKVLFVANETFEVKQKMYNYEFLD